MTEPIQSKEIPTSKEVIELHTAKLIIDSNGYIFKPDVLKELVIGSIVRVFMTMKNPPMNLWSHDSPYLSIVMIDKDTNQCLGDILDIDRIEECNKYPLATGERIWFSFSNIIEIPIKEQSKNKEKKIKTYLTTDHVTATGPLYTINHTNIEYDSDESDASYSDRE